MKHFTVLNLIYNNLLHFGLEIGEEATKLLNVLAEMPI